MAIAISGLILTYGTGFLVSLNADWVTKDESRYFDEHVGGVVRFFDGVLAKNIMDSRLDAEDRYPFIEIPEGLTDNGLPFVRFRFPDGCPLFISEMDPGGPTTAYFGIDENEGLVAYWYSDVREDVDTVDDMSRTLITPFVREGAFIYYDEEEEEWAVEDEIREDVNGQPVLPDRVQLTFRLSDEIQIKKSLVLRRDETDIYIY